MRAIKTIIMIAVGILLAYGGIQWTIQTSVIYDINPGVTVAEDFNVTITPPRGRGNWRDASFFPAVMGITAGIVWIFFAFIDMSFPGAVWQATGIMLIPIGVLGFLRGLFNNPFFTDGLNTGNMKTAFPSPVLRFLFVEHPMLSVFIFAAAAGAFIRIGILIETAVAKYTKSNSV